MGKEICLEGEWQRKEKACEIPIWEKKCLTIEEVAAYSGIGQTKIRELTERMPCPYVMWTGRKRFIIRDKFDEFISKQFKI